MRGERRIRGVRGRGIQIKYWNELQNTADLSSLYLQGISSTNLQCSCPQLLDRPTAVALHGQLLGPLDLVIVPV